MEIVPFVASCAAMHHGWQRAWRSGWRRWGWGLWIAAGCRPSPAEPPPASAASADAALTQHVYAVMDEGADPCTDFYRYACGQWLDDHPLPPDQPRYGRFDDLRERNKQAMREILEQVAADPAASGATGQLGRFYAGCMDEAGADATGLAPLRPLLDRIDQATTPAARMTLVAQLHQLGATPLFTVEVEPDYDDPKTNLAHLGQGGLGLPDRDYYLESTEAAQALRAAYQDHIARMLGGAGVSQADARAREILALETALAQVTTPRDQLRDPQRRRHRIDAPALAHLSPSLPWDAYLAAAGRPDVARFNVAPPSFFSGMDRVMAPVGSDLWRAYLTWHLLHGLGPHLPSALARAHFEFFDQRLRGQAEPTPRWRRCVEATDEALGEALGRQFVQRYFTASSKRISAEMITQIEAAFESALPRLSWMDDDTRARALDKMHAIVNKVGYPESWRDYAGLEIGAQHLANVIAGRRFRWRYEADKIGRAVDEGEWHMTPPTVNAYYNPSGNEMVFPAGILQPPFFSAQYPMAMNFGGIGMVMGHELTHGFDDQGRKFDGDGRLTEWWEPDVVSRFEARAQCVQTLYDGYEIQPGITLNGALTLGENIADLGGIRQAHGAYLAWAADHDGDRAPAVEGLTNEQLLFVAFGQIWCTHASAQTERVLARTDPHSHARYRVNGPLSNYPAFWDVFSCEEGTPMHPPQVCEVW